MTDENYLTIHIPVETVTVIAFALHLYRHMNREHLEDALNDCPDLRSRVKTSPAQAVRSLVEDAEEISQRLFAMALNFVSSQDDDEPEGVPVRRRAPGSLVA